VLFLRGPIPAAASIGAAEEPGRVVLDAQRLAAVNRLAADERVLALLELEAEEVGRGDELRASCLFQQPVAEGVGRRIAGWKFRFGRDNGHRGPLLTLALLAFLLPFQIVGLVFTPVAVRDVHAVDSQRAADEEAVADVPRVFATFAPDLHAAGTTDVDRLALVEHVLPQLPPVLVALLEHLLDEG